MSKPKPAVIVDRNPAGYAVATICREPVNSMVRLISGLSIWPLHCQVNTILHTIAYIFALLVALIVVSFHALAVNQLADNVSLLQLLSNSTMLIGLQACPGCYTPLLICFVGIYAVLYHDISIHIL